MRDASATWMDVSIENAQNMRSVWTAWFQFWRKQHHLRVDVLFFRSILNEQRIQWVQLDRLKKALKCNDTYLHLHRILCTTDKLPDAHLKLECNVLHSNVDFYFKFDEYSKFEKKNDSPNIYIYIYIYIYIFFTSGCRTL